MCSRVKKVAAEPSGSIVAPRACSRAALDTRMWQVAVSDRRVQVWGWVAAPPTFLLHGGCSSSRGAWERLFFFPVCSRTLERHRRTQSPTGVPREELMSVSAPKGGPHPAGGNWRWLRAGSEVQRYAVENLPKYKASEARPGVGCEHLASSLASESHQ